MSKYKVLLLLVFGLLAGTAYSQDAQWRGPERDGLYPDKGLLKQWPAEGPQVVLKKEGLGAGWTTPVISEKVIYVSGRRDSIEVLTALTMDGTVLWENTYQSKSIQTNSSRSCILTPSGNIIMSGFSYCFGGGANLHDAATIMVDTASGALLWRRI